MHTRASNSELVEPLPEPERTLNRRLRRRNRRVPYDQRNNPPQHPRIVYPSILDINYFRHFLDILRNYEIQWMMNPCNHLTLVKGNQFDGKTKTDPHKYIHEFLVICDMFKYKDTENEAVRLMMFPLSLTREAKHGWTNSTEELLKRGINFKPLSLADYFPQLFLIKSSEKSVCRIRVKFERSMMGVGHDRSLPSNTQPNPRGSNSKAYQPPQAHNEHVNAVFTRSDKSYNPPDNPDDQQDNSKNLINFDSDDEDDEPTPQPKT
ncbi:hypothetical protein Tco_1051512 [Tanacetum coccineum]